MFFLPVSRRDGLSEAVERFVYLWPLDRGGESISWETVESHAGQRNVRAIAAVRGIGELRLGVGTLRPVFSTPDAAGCAVVDEVAWEVAIPGPVTQEPERRARLSC